MRAGPRKPRAMCAQSSCARDQSSQSGRARAAGPVHGYARPSYNGYYVNLWVHGYAPHMHKPKADLASATFACCHVGTRHIGAVGRRGMGVQPSGVRGHERPRNPPAPLDGPPPRQTPGPLPAFPRSKKKFWRCVVARPRSEKKFWGCVIARANMDLERLTPQYLRV